MTQALLDLWMSQSSQGETQFINRDLSEKMLISEIESKNQGFVDTTAAFHRACAQSRLPHIKVTPHQGYPPSRLPPIHAPQPQCKLSWRSLVARPSSKLFVGEWQLHTTTQCCNSVAPSLFFVSWSHNFGKLVCETIQDTLKWQTSTQIHAHIVCIIMYMCVCNQACVYISMCVCVQSDMALHVDVYSFALFVLIGCMCICVYIQVICSIYTHV